MRLQLHRAIYRPDSFVLMLRHCVNLKAIRYESTSLNRIAADKSHRVIVAWVRHIFEIEHGGLGPRRNARYNLRERTHVLWRDMVNNNFSCVASTLRCKTCCNEIQNLKAVEWKSQCVFFLHILLHKGLHKKTRKYKKKRWQCMCILY